MTYTEKVLSYTPLVYYPMSEAAGAACVNVSALGAVANGVYTGVTLGQPGIGDGGTAPYFDGTNDYATMPSDAVITTFNGQEVTVSAWFKLDAGEWANGTFRMVVNLAADANNYIYMRKRFANDMAFEYKGGGVEDHVYHAMNPAAWTHVALTASRTADELKAYVSGGQVGATQGTLGVHTNVLGTWYIGSVSAIPAQTWKGHIAHVTVFDSALPVESILDLATV